MRITQEVLQLLNIEHWSYPRVLVPPVVTEETPQLLMKEEASAPTVTAEAPALLWTIDARSFTDTHGAVFVDDDKDNDNDDDDYSPEDDGNSANGDDLSEELVVPENAPAIDAVPENKPAKVAREMRKRSSGGGPPDKFNGRTRSER